MAFTAFRGMGAWAQLIMAGFIVLVCFLLLFILSIPAALPFIGFSELMGALTSGDPDNPLTIAVLKYFQVVQSIGLFVLPPVLIGWLFSGNIVRYLQLDRKVEVMPLLLAIGAVLIINPFISFVGELNSKMSLPGFLSDLEEWMRKMEDQAAQLIDRFMEVKTLGGLLFNLFMIAVIPAVGEEFLFRGVFQKIFTQMTRNYHWGIWISAFLFSALHMQFYGFVPRMLLGALFGYMLVYSGSLWLPIACHFVNNALGVLYLYFEKQGMEEVGRLSEIGEKTIYMVPLAAASLILTIWLILALRKRSERLKGEIDL
jgi:membrane protease YdiL (CAAX protease family)